MRIFGATILIFFVDLFYWIISVLLILRIILRLFAANPNTPFAGWVYSTTAPLLYPLRGIFPSPSATGGYTLELSTIFALIIYAIVFYLIAALIRFVANSVYE